MFFLFNEEPHTTARERVGETGSMKFCIANSSDVRCRNLRWHYWWSFQGKVWAVFSTDVTAETCHKLKLIQYNSDALSTEPKFVLRDDHGGGFVGRALVIFRHLHSG